jgi:hypothetical protein
VDKRKCVAHMPTAATAVEDSDPKLGQTHPHDFTKRQNIYIRA